VRIAVANLKGGAGKTTSALHLAAAMHERGDVVTLIDADPQGTALESCRTADVPWRAASHPRASIERRVAEIDARESVVIDTPPGHVDIAKSALRAVDIVLIPCQPTSYDLSQLAETRSMVDSVATVRPLLVAVLLTRVFTRTIAARASRELLDGQGLTVLPTVIPNSQNFALTWGQPITPGVYAQVLDDLGALA
jgi:chromosome partitioning protein